MTRTVTRIPSRHRTTHRRHFAAFLAIAATVLASLSLTAAPAAASPRTVSGTVSFGTDGNHPAGVSAVVTWQPYETSVYVPGPAEGVRTDAEGRYSLSLEPGTYTLIGVANVSGGTTSTELLASFGIEFLATAPDDESSAEQAEREVAGRHAPTQAQQGGRLSVSAR